MKVKELIKKTKKFQKEPKEIHVCNYDLFEVRDAKYSPMTCGCVVLMSDDVDDS